MKEPFSTCKKNKNTTDLTKKEIIYLKGQIIMFSKANHIGKNMRLIYIRKFNNAFFLENIFLFGRNLRKWYPDCKI